mmetsp:Transcript_19631/g.27611  ORF Transcript_19631/g.27611 Transcript_19631/m.27611 type:complete len:134 (-) Transcript_19631:536-937(-)
MFDWTVLNLQQEKARLPPERPLLSSQQQVGQGGDNHNASRGDDGHAGGGSRREYLATNNSNQYSRDDNDPNVTSPSYHRKNVPEVHAFERERSRASQNDYHSHSHHKDPSQRSGSRGYGGRTDPIPPPGKDES